MNVENVRNIAVLILALMAFAGVTGGLLLIYAVHRIRSLNIPADATFSETLRLTPLAIVIAIDLLDLSLDFLAAPLSWAILDRLGLKALRGVAAIEALIPGTQFIPAMTLCWFGARLFNSRFDSATYKQFTAR